MNQYGKYAAARDLVDSEEKPKLLVKTLQKLLEKLDIVVCAIENKDYEKKYNELSKITTVIEILSASLDMSHGEVSSNLQKLYAYLAKKLREVHVSLDIDTIKECRYILANITEGFEKAYEIERQKNAATKNAGFAGDRSQGPMEKVC
jgi:flagellar biosynthetic protein FliS